MPDGARSEAIRDAEAEVVADISARLIGAYLVRDGNRGLRPCRAGDIALLAPTGAELWRYERALEARSIPVATQAGKGFFRRQEIQDLIALASTLADARDTLALGSLLRGQLVGLTEEALLDPLACQCCLVGRARKRPTSAPLAANHGDTKAAAPRDA